MATAVRAGGAPGKLRAAARAWAFARLGRTDHSQPVRIDDDLVRQFRAMGVEVPPGLLTSVPDTDEGFEVHPANWTSLRAFLACETQWRVAATLAGVIWLGLDYPAVEVVLRHAGAGTEVFADLQVMEREALDVFAEVRT